MYDKQTCEHSSNFLLLFSTEEIHTGWNDMRVSKWWNKFNFGVNYPFNVTLEDFFNFSFEISVPQKKTHWPNSKITWNCLDISCCRAIADCCWKYLEQDRSAIIIHGAFCLTFTNGAVHPFRAWHLGGKCSRTRVQCGTSGGNEAICFHLSEGQLTYMCCRKLDTFFVLPVCTDLSVSLRKMWVNAYILFLVQGQSWPNG